MASVQWLLSFPGPLAVCLSSMPVAALAEVSTVLEARPR